MGERRGRTDPRGEATFFVAPTGDYMTLICFKNVRSRAIRIRDQYGLGLGRLRKRLLQQTDPAAAFCCRGLEPEIVPRVNRPGVASV